MKTHINFHSPNKNHPSFIHPFIQIIRRPQLHSTGSKRCINEQKTCCLTRGDGRTDRLVGIQYAFFYILLLLEVGCCLQPLFSSMSFFNFIVTFFRYFFSLVTKLYFLGFLLLIFCMHFLKKINKFKFHFFSYLFIWCVSFQVQVCNLSPQMSIGRLSVFLSFRPSVCLSLVVLASVSIFS